MARIERSIRVTAAPERVWPLLFWHRLPEWLDLFKTVECTSDTPNQVGATFHAIGEAGGVKTEFDVEVTELVDATHAVWRTTGGSFTGFGRTSLQRAENDTEITFMIDYELPYSVLGSILDKLMVSRAIEQGFERGLEKLKQIVE
jgi:uncharacterized membrane protein